MKTIKWLVLAVILSGFIVAASMLYNNLSKDYAGNNLEIYGGDLLGGSELNGSGAQVNTRPTASSTSSETTFDVSITENATTSTSVSATTSASATVTESATTGASATATESTTTSASTTVTESTTSASTTVTESTTAQTTKTETTTSASQEEYDPYRAPNFTVLDVNGNEVKLSDFRGKPVVLNFWATWCYYCKSEMADFNQAYYKYPDIQFLMVNATDGVYETISSAKKYVAQEGYDFDVFFDTKEEAVNAYYVTGFPTTYFIDANGRLVARAVGMIDLETLEVGIGMIT